MDSARSDIQNALAGRRPPNRTTVQVPTRISPEALEHAQADAAWLGYRTLRAYLEALIMQGLVDGEGEGLGAEAPQPFASAVLPELPTLLGHRTLLALEAVTSRIRAGEDVAILAQEVQGLRRDIAGVLRELRTAYDAELDARQDRLWDGKHS